MSNFSLSESIGGRTLKSIVVPTTGRSPTLAHIGGLFHGAEHSSSHRKPSFWCNRGKGSCHTSLGSSISMHNGRSLASVCYSCGLIHAISWEAKNRCNARHHQQRWKGSLFERQHVPMPQSVVYGIDNSEGGHPRAHVLARGPWGQGKEPWMSIHQSTPMPGKSPRNTADTYPSKAIQPVLIESKALLFGTELTASARTQQKLSYSVPKGHGQS